MQQAEEHESVAVPMTALVLAASAAVLLGTGDLIVGLRTDAADSAFTATVILGWALLVWAVLFAGASAVSIGRRLLSRRTVTRLELALVVAVSALLVAVVATHPLWGSGSSAP